MKRVDPVPHLRVRELTRRFAEEPVLDRVSFDLEAGHTLSVLGRSGSGKTTLLRIMAGLERSDAGDVLLRGESVLGRSPERRGIVYLNQEPLLFPHLDVAGNVAFGLRLRHVDASEIDRQVSTMLEDLDLGEHARKRPQELSGGQRQRVAFGRAAILRPGVMLLDEPFASLDVDLRGDMQRLYRKLARAHAMTTLFVTHDLKEALIMGDRIAHLNEGRMRCYETKADFVHDPESGVAGEIRFWSEWTRSDPR